MRECPISARSQGRGGGGGGGVQISHDNDTYPEESVVLLPQIDVAIGALTHTKYQTDHDQGGKGRAGQERKYGALPSL